MDNIAKKIKHVFWFAVVHITVFAAVALSLVRIAMPYAENYLHTIEAFVESKLGMSVTIQHLDSGWQGLGPALRFEGVRVADLSTGEELASAHYVDVQLDVLGSIFKRDWVLGRLTADGLTVHLRQEQGSETLNVIPVPLIQQFNRIVVKNAEVYWPMKKGSPLVLNIEDFYVHPEKNKQHIELVMHIGDAQSRIQLIVDTKGDWLKPEALDIEGFVRLKDVALDKRFMPHRFENVNWTKGQVNGDLWFHYDKGLWRKVVGHAELSDMFIKNMKTKKLLPFAFTGDIAIEEKEEGYFLFTADDVSLTLQEKLSALNSWAIEIFPEQPWQVKLNAISLFDAISAARMLGYLNEDMEKKLLTHDPHARLFDIEWVGVPGDATGWHLGFQVSDVYQKANGKIPGLDNLSGMIKISPTGGEFAVNSENVTVVAPQVYSQAIEIDKAEGLITWTNTPFEIKTTQFVATDRDMSASVTADVSIPTSGSPYLSLLVTTSEMSRDDVLYYLPGKILKPALFRWISAAFSQGSVSSATGRVEGELKDFPYDNGKGVFELKFALQDTLLTYNPEWPPIEDVRAQLVIDGKKFQAYIDSGRYHDTVIKQAVAAIDYSDARKPLVLTLSGDIAGPASDAETFLKKSPLWSFMGAGLSILKVEGTLETNLDLHIPLDDRTQAKTAGTVILPKGTISMPAWGIDFTDVSGAVHFQDGCMEADNIKAVFLKHPATLRASCKKTAQGFTHDWVLSSQFDQKDFQSYLTPAFQKLITGGSTYTATLSTASGNQNAVLTVASDLKGIAIHVPAPIGKAAPDVKKSMVRLPIHSGNTFAPIITYDGLFNAALLFEKTKTAQDVEKMLFKGANITLGTEAASVPQAAGLTVSGKITTLHADEWLSFFEKIKTPGEKPLEVQGGFWVDTLFYKDFRLLNTHLTWKRLGSAWQVKFDGPGAIGTVTTPDTMSVSNPLKLTFSKYVWEPQPENKPQDTTPDADPSAVPPIDFDCEEFFYQNQLLGKVSLRVRPTQSGVVFDPVSIISSVHTLEAKGSWIKSADKNAVTLFEGNAKTNNVGDTLTALNMKSDIVDSKGEATFNIEWPGSPGKFSKGAIAGNMSIKLGKGRLTAVNPGLGRLLGLFSVESIQRRLQFDFSDLFQKGFSFDTFEAKITAAKGFASTTDATLKAPSANMTLTGKVGLVNQSLDFVLDVKSNANSAVPTLGAAAVAIANPAVGAAVWLAGKMFNPLEGLGHYRYHVTGTWQAPVFTDISSEIKNDPKPPVSDAKQSK